MRLDSRDNVWEARDEAYSERQIESILNKLDIEVVGETGTHFMGYCPFHDNHDSPAFVIDKLKGLWTCFNPSCGEAGTLEELVRRINKCNPFAAQMLILKSADDDEVPLADRRARIKEEASKELKEFRQDKLDELYENFSGSPAQTYMYGRGFTDETLDYFRVGYSPEKEYPTRPAMVTVPMHDAKGMPIGLIGRSIEGKQFKNSKGLPKKKTIWNIHRAKREGSTLIVVEASFDGMRVHQAGYPNVGAVLGGHVTPFHLEQMDRYFDTIIMMTDFEHKGENDKGDLITFEGCRRCSPKPCRGHRPGRDLGHSIARQLPNKKILWATYDDTCVYPHKAKDAGAMTDDEIRQCLKNSISNYQYNKWGIENRGLLW